MMNLLVSEIFPTDPMPDQLVPWMDDSDATRTFAEGRLDECDARPGETWLSWSELPLSTRWSALANLL